MAHTEQIPLIFLYNFFTIIHFYVYCSETVTRVKQTIEAVMQTFLIHVRDVITDHRP